MCVSMEVTDLRLGIVGKWVRFKFEGNRERPDVSFGFLISI